MRRVSGLVFAVLSIVAAASFAPGARAQTVEYAVAPEDCVIEPIATLQPGEVGDLATPAPTPTAINATDGTPVDRAVAHAVSERIAMAIACQNAGDPLRMLANFTARWIAERFSGYDLVFFGRFQEEAADPEPLPADQRIELLSIDDVFKQSDGSVVATVVTRLQGEEQTSLVMLVEEAGVWLIDGGDLSRTE